MPSSLNPGPVAVLAAVTLGTSFLIRGRRRSLRLLATATAVSAAAEILAIRGARLLRHHSQPQVAGLPLLIPVAWYAYVAPAYGLAQAACGGRGPMAVAAATALLATATDLANDPWGLASGYWEWRDGGAHMPAVVGPNGVAGIPLANYAGWLAISGTVALLNERGRPEHEAAAARRHRTPLLLTYTLLGLGGIHWAARERRWPLFATAAAAVFGGGWAAWRRAGYGGH